MNLEDLRARVKRLDELSRGLTKECLVVEAADGPLHYAERRDYLTGIHSAIQGIGAARIALFKAVHRLDGKPKDG